jgi:putative PEP-CTERM system histidine kinase
MNGMMAFAAALASGVLAVAVLLRRRSTITAWTFSGGMLIFGLVSTFEALAAGSELRNERMGWETCVLLAKAFVPGVWLAFSLVYSRGNAREFLQRWRWVLFGSCAVPVVLAVAFRSALLELVTLTEPEASWFLRYADPAKILHGLILLGSVLILTNLEKTFRAAVGTSRWRIKFVVLGLGLIFAAWIYTHTQALLYSVVDPDLTVVETGALLLGCGFIAVAYARSGFAEIDVYPSHAVLQKSVIVVVAGLYLFAVGVLAQIVARFGGARSFQTQALLVLLGIAVLAVVVLSDRFRQTVQGFVSRHFKRPTHDYREVWTQLTRRTASTTDEASCCESAATFLSQLFNALSVTIWVLDEQRGLLLLEGSTSRGEGVSPAVKSDMPISADDISKIHELTGPVDLEGMHEEWATPLKGRTEGQFQHGGHRLCVPLVASDRTLGIAILADRVSGVPYALDELDLLKCIADQLGAALLNFRLTRDLMQAKELEAFQTMSTFFVHDLKNAASGLGLTLQNLPLHFDNPDFRKDALRALGNSVGRINHFIQRLTALRQKLELRREESNLNELVESAIESVGQAPDIELDTDLENLPPVLVDREHLGSVVTNLLLNARDAVAGTGKISVRTGKHGSRAVLTVQDNGCGMSAEFIRDSLFRPFQTTKKQGLGIGMFQSKMIVEAHGGSMVAHSRPGHGTTFTVALPLHPRA